MTIAGKSETITLENIMVGDVWVCSGQSNMEWDLQNSNNAKEEIANANDKMIRHFKVSRTYSDKPEEKLEGGPWQVASPEVAGSFTAVGYFFAKNLRQEENVTIGLLNTSWGGSRLEPWMSADALGFPDAKGVLTKIRQDQEKQMQAAKENLIKHLGKLPEKDEGLQGEKAVWAAADLNESDWNTMELPSLWEQRGLANLDGIVWFRKTIELSEAEAAAGITLGLGKIDDADITWVNGQKVGETNGYNTDRVYEVPASVLKSGKNVITFRAEDTGGGGGVHGGADLMYVKTSAGERPLSGEWKYKIGEARFSAAVTGIHQTPTVLYNKMIHPMLDFPIKGAIWYQGESNTGGEDAYKYRDLFAKMIKDWRQRWNSGEFPFLYVQLANFMQPQAEPGESGWAMLRESQTKTLSSTPNTGQAVIIDIGEANDIHPRNKQDVGYRLALAAQKVAYGKNDIVYSGPIYKSMKKDGNKIRLGFDHVGSGLMAKDKYGYLKSFAIAGADKKFVWAQAIIDGEEVVVWSDKVPNPVAVRYAWADNPDDANFYNKEGLPASPFRTDEW